LEETIKITETDWTEIRPVWIKFLWSLKPKDTVASISSMKFLGGYNSEIKKNRPYFWIMKHQHQVVGTISGFITGSSEFRSRGIWIADDYRGQGISSRLFQTVQDRATELGCCSIWSYPRLSALPAYQKFGFNVVGDIIYSLDPYSPHTYVEKKL
jgi:GNAT superfamily N-acetyltransferase